MTLIVIIVFWQMIYSDIHNGFIGLTKLATFCACHFLEYRIYYHRADTPPKTATAVEGTHATRMHSCL